MKYHRFLLFAIIMASLVTTSCRTPKTIIDTRYVHDTTYVSRVDSVFKHDSIVREKETVVMQLDSMEMAQYGIHLKNAESAWLVKTRELEMILKEMREIKNDSTYHSKVDSVFIDRPQFIEVEKKLTWWQGLRMAFGDIFLVFLVLFAIGCTIKIKIKS